MKFWIVLCTAFYIATKLVICERSPLMNSALKKACDIITDTLFGASDLKEKAEVLRYVEEKWKIFSPTEEINNDFMNLVIHAIKSMVSRNDYRLCTVRSDMAKDALLKMFNLTEPSTTNAPESKPSINDEKKKELLRKTVHKIDALVKKALQKSKSDEDKKKIIDFIKKRIENAFQPKGKPNETNLYGRIISQTIDMMTNKSIQRLVKAKYRNLDEAAPTDVWRKRNEAALGGIENLVHNPSQLKLIPSSMENDNVKPTLETDIHNSGKDIVDNNLGEIITPGPFIGLTKEYDCREIVSQMCMKLRNVSEFKCESVDEVVGIQQFCDGTVDCPDGSDEINCAVHAVNRIQAATQIVAEIDLAKNCFDNAIGSSMLPQQGAILSQLLQKQVAFIEKYTSDTKSRAFFKTSPYNDILEVVTEVVAIIKSFSLSLNTALCINVNNEVDKIISEGESLLDAEPTSIKSVDEMLRECDCNNHVCLKPTCPAVCKRICYQTYSLSRWACKPVKEGAAGVSLDDICDGKNDCYDKSDESNCVSDDFEANFIFEEILKATKTYSMSKNFETVRSRLVSLHSAVRQLQKHSKGLNNNNAIYKMERDNIFSMLSDIYLDMVEEFNDMDRAEEAFVLLVSLNEKLVRALKRSYTGNEKPQTIAEVCTCRNKKCTQSNCTKKCVRLCFVRDLLTTYPCSNSSGNHSVYVDIICNGKAQCPKGEDEQNCGKEICRRHHLIMLRHKLQTELDKYKHTALGGALESWKQMASKHISNVEKSERLTPVVYKMLLQDILRDLADTYARNELLEESKMVSNERILKKYHELGISVMELAKTCSK